jgi:hypothetical protein
VVKNPLDQSKRSLAGRMQVIRMGDRYDIVPEEQWPGPDYHAVQLRPVFENGIVLRKQTFADIRHKARSYK